MDSDLISRAPFPFAGALRAELAVRNRFFARSYPHVESYGSNPVIVYAPECGLHGNFYPPAYAAIAARPDWIRRFDKIHAQGRSLPRPSIDPARKWRELDSCMSSDALLMNLFCTPEVIASPAIRRMLGIDSESEPNFGWKARVPLRNGRVDRTEVDLRWGELLVEAKLTESDFQIREARLVETYRDLGEVFDLDLLQRVQIRTRRRRNAVELTEEFTQEWEAPSEAAEEIAREFQASLEARAEVEQPWLPGYAGYQLIRNVLAAHVAGASFCTIHDQRRPDLREAWFDVMRAVKNAEMRVRCKSLTWQEIVPCLPVGLRDFLNLKYGIGAPAEIPMTIEELEARKHVPEQAGVRK
ncbi:MAG: hypothetical protein WCA10_07535 [Terracidiphilus sp.]